MSVRTFTGVILAATIQNLRTTSVTQTTIALAWDVYPGATGYEIRRNGTLVQTWYSGTQTTYSNSGHTAGTSYTYAVRPVVGGSGVASAQASIVVMTLAASGVPFAGLTPTVTVSTAAALQSALASATAGAIIGVEPGVYVGPNNGTGRWAVSWRTTNSGASGNPIRVVARNPASTNVGGAVSELRNSVAGPVFGCVGQNYVEWIGFYVNQTNSPSSPDTGPVIMAPATGSSIERCHIVGNTSYNSQDNNPGIRFEYATNCAARDNLIEYMRCTVVNGNNGAGIQLYDSTGSVMEYNTIRNCGSGIFHKGPGSPVASGGATIRYNRIESSVFSGIILSELSQGTSTAFNLVERNLILNCGEQGIYLWTLAAATSPNRVRVRRNTVVDCASGIQIQCGTSALFGPSDITDNLTQGGTRILNSVVMTAANYAALRTSVGLSFNYNAGHGASSGNWILAYSTNMTRAAWNSATGLDANSQYLTSDISTIFANKAAGNYRPGSAVQTISSTGGPVGCYDVSGGTDPGVRA